MTQVLQQIVQTEGMAVLWKGVVLRSVVLGVGSLVFWPIQHTVTRYLLAPDSSSVSSSRSTINNKDYSYLIDLSESDMPLEVYN